MKIYVVTTGENAITVSLNGEAAVAKTSKPTLTALGNGRILFECDGISEEVETYRHIFVNATPLKGSWIAEEDYLSVALFEAIMNKTFVSSGEGGGELDINGLDAADALDGTEEVPVFQGSNKKTTTQDIADLGGGGSGYLVYTAILTQPGAATDPIVPRAFQNTIGAGDWVRGSAGVYTNITTTQFDLTKIWIGASAVTENGDYYYPLYDGEDLVAVFALAFYAEAGNVLTVELYLKDSTGVPIDIADLVPTQISLPEIRIYP